MTCSFISPVVVISPVTRYGTLAELENSLANQYEHINLLTLLLMASSMGVCEAIAANVRLCARRSVRANIDKFKIYL